MRPESSLSCQTLILWLWVTFRLANVTCCPKLLTFCRPSHLLLKVFLCGSGTRSVNIYYNPNWKPESDQSAPLEPIKIFQSAPATACHGTPLHLSSRGMPAEVVSGRGQLMGQRSSLALENPRDGACPFIPRESLTAVSSTAQAQANAHTGSTSPSLAGLSGNWQNHSACPYAAPGIWTS